MKPAVLLAIVLCATPLYAARRADDGPHTALKQSLDRFHLPDPAAQWSLRAQVQFLDRDTPTSAGTVEFLRVSAEQYRVTYDFPGFHQVLTATPQGQFVEGDLGDPPAGLSDLLHFLRKPLDRVGLDVSEIGTFHVKAKTSRLNCMYTMHDPWPTARDLTFCTAADSSTLRYVHLHSHYEFFFVQTGVFDGGDVPVIADVLYAGMRIARVRLAFHTLTAAEQASVQPPPGARHKFDGEVDRDVTHKLTLSLFHPPSPAHVQNVSLLDSLPPTMVLRLQLAPSGAVAEAQVLASRDPRQAKAFADSLIGRSMTAPARAARFVNYNIVVTQPQDSFSDFWPIGDDPAMMAAPAISRGP